MASACPFCKDRPLNPTRIEGDLPALGCEHCNGALLSLVSYRHWRERRPAHDDSAHDGTPLEVVDVKDTPLALQCPKCERFMTKFRLSADTRNHIDLCVHCDEVWLDQGEWRLIDSLALAGSLTRVFTQPWQSHVRQVEATRRAEERWAERLGTDYERARETLAWLKDGDNAHDVLTYLNQALDETPR